MKKTFLTFAVAALVLTFTSCRESSSENEENSVEIMESPEETTIDAVETPAEEVVDTTGTNDSIVEDNSNTTSVE